MKRDDLVRELVKAAGILGELRKDPGYRTPAVLNPLIHQAGQAAIKIEEDGEEIERLKGELEEARAEAERWEVSARLRHTSILELQKERNEGLGRIKDLEKENSSIDTTPSSKEAQPQPSQPSDEHCSACGGIGELLHGINTEGDHEPCPRCNPQTPSDIILSQQEKPCRFEDASFEKALNKLLDRYQNIFEGGRTPDFVLALYIGGCLKVFNRATVERDVWNQTCKGCGNPAMPWPDLCADCEAKPKCSKKETGE